MSHTVMEEERLLLQAAFAEAVYNAKSRVLADWHSLPRAVEVHLSGSLILSSRKLLEAGL